MRRIQPDAPLASPRQQVHVAVHNRWKRPFDEPGLSPIWKDKQLYQDQLSREAKLIVQGRQEWLRDFAVIWDRLMARLGISAPKAPATDAETH